jgi:monolysocardiolipin acyltransferase
VCGVCLLVCRWTLCASDRCFHRDLLVPFFRAAKVLPVERGAGMFQQGLAAAEARLAAGDWVHIFPEGTRSRDGKMGPVRKGVGRLVAACAEAQPVIVPFVHSGMEEVLPKGSLLPKANKEVRGGGSGGQ